MAILVPENAGGDEKEDRKERAIAHTASAYLGPFSLQVRQSPEGPKRDSVVDLDSADALIERISEGRRRRFSALQAVRRDAAGIDPQRAAKAVKLAFQEKLPVELVDENLEEIEAEAKIRQGPPEDWWRRHPITFRYVRSNPYYAKLTDQEIEQIGNLVDDLLTRPRWAWPIPEPEIKRLAELYADEELRERLAGGRAAEQARAAAFLGTGAAPLGVPKAPVSEEEKARLRELLREQHEKRLRDENAFLLNREPMGIRERLGGPQAPLLAERVPFIGDLFTLGKGIELFRAAKAVEDGHASENQIELLRRLWRLEKAAELRGSTFMGDVADIGASILKSVPEFATTAGVYGATKEGARRLIISAAKKATEGAVRRAAVGAVAGLSGAAAQAAVMGATRTIAGTIARMTPQAAFSPQLEAEIQQEGDDFIPALLRSFGIETTEAASERFGEALRPITGSLKRFVAGRWIAGRPEQGVSGFLQRLAQAGGWHGPLAEVLEERIAGVGRRIIEGEGIGPALTREIPAILGGELSNRQILAEAVAFAIPSLSGRILSATERRIRRLPPGVDEANAEVVKTLGDEIRKLTVAKASPELVEEMASKASEASGNPFFWAPVEKWNEYWKSRKDNAGNPLDPRQAALDVGVDPEAYDVAARTGSDFPIPKAKYLLVLGPSEHNAALASILRASPEQALQEEVREFLQLEEERISREEEELEKRRRELESSQEIQARARALALEAAKERLRILEESDVIAEISRMSVGGRIYWSDSSGKRNVEELRASRVPKRMIADPVTARKRGPTYAIAIDEVADRLGISSDEVIQRIEQAVEARRRAKEAIESPKIPEGILAGVIEDEISRTLGEVYRPKAREEEPRREELPHGRAAAEQVGSLVREELVRAGFRKEDAEAQAKLYEAAFRVLGERTGENPLLLFRRYGLRIVRRGLEMAGLGRPEEARLVLHHLSEGEKEPLGRIRIGKSFTEIELLKKANLSTFLHETGHFFLEVLGDAAESEGASEDLRKDWKTILDFLGVKERAEIKPEHHEKFARAFETYLMEGKAPSSALRRAFAKFRAWLMMLYRKMTGLGLELSHEVRRVFDRLLATEEEILEAEAYQGYRTLDPRALGMSLEEERFYTELKEEARRRAEEKLSKQVTRERSVIWRKEYQKALKQVREELQRDPRYITFYILSRSELPDGRRVGDPGDWKLSSKIIEENFGGPGRLSSLKMIVAKEGHHPDQAVELLRASFGISFPSGEELLQAMEKLPPLEKMAREIARKRTEEAIGPQPGTVEMAGEVQSAIHNEVRGRLLLLELRHLAGRSGRRVAPLEVVRHWAKAQVEERLKLGRSVIGMEATYRRAAAKANKAAFEATSLGQFERAFDEKERELLNLELHRAVVEASKEVKKGLEYVSRLMGKASREAIGRAGGDYLEQIDGILERFDLAPISQRAVEKRQALLEWVRKRQEANEPVDVPEELLNEAYRKSWREMTLLEFRGIIDTLRHLEHLARLKGRLLKVAAKRRIEDIALEAAGRIAESAAGAPRRILEARAPEEERRRSVGAFFAGMVRIQSLFRVFDGFKDGGFFFDVFLKNVNEASERRDAMAQEAVLRFQAIREKYYTKEEWRRIQGTKRYFAGVNGAYSKEAVLAVALNWGNEDNRAKLLAGRAKDGWTESGVQEMLDSLEERDWKFVQEIWDWIDEYWPAVKELERRVHGIVPKKVVSSPVVTRYGTFRGGYYPLKYESRESERAGLHEAQEAAEGTLRAATVRATTRHGHRKERLKGVKLPVRLDLGVLFTHLRDVIHDLTHYEVLLDLNRIVRHAEFQDAVKRHYGDVTYQEIKQWLADIATGPKPASDAVERGLLWIRTGTIISRLAFNVKSMLLQFTGIGMSVKHLGASYVLRAMKGFFGTPSRMAATLRWVRQESSFMRHRLENQFRELGELREQAFQRGELTKLQDSWLWGISRSQYLVDTITWLGAYEKAMERLRSENKDALPEELHKKAIPIADQAVLDTQGSGNVKDLAGVMRGHPLKKLFTTFYGYFNLVYNQTWLSIQEFRRSEKRIADIGKLMSDLMWIYTFPSAVTALLAVAVRPEDEDETLTEVFAKHVAIEHLSLAMNSVVLIRELTGAIQGFQYQGPAGTVALADLGRLVYQIGQMELDEPLARSFIHSVAEFTPWRFPATQIWRTYSGIRALTEGETESPLAPLLGPPGRN